MDLNRRTDYACRMIRAAYKNDGKVISVTKVAEQEGSPYAFARSIQNDLVHAGLLRAERGAGGSRHVRDPRSFMCSNACRAPSP